MGVTEGARVEVKLGGRWLPAVATGRGCYVSIDKARRRRAITGESTLDAPGGCFWYEVQVHGFTRKGQPCSWAGARLVPEGRLRHAAT